MVDVPCEVEKPVQEAYEVEVMEPVTTYEEVAVKYFDTVPREMWVNETVTTAVPIVVRVCTDGKGRKITKIADVPLHHSGPSIDQLAAGGQVGGNQNARVPAQLVNAPLDWNNGQNLIQVGTVESGAGPAQFGPANSHLGTGFEYPGPNTNGMPITPTAASPGPAGAVAAPANCGISGCGGQS